MADTKVITKPSTSRPVKISQFLKLTADGFGMTFFAAGRGERTRGLRSGLTSGFPSGLTFFGLRGVTGLAFAGLSGASGLAFAGLAGASDFLAIAGLRGVTGLAFGGLREATGSFIRKNIKTYQHN